MRIRKELLFGFSLMAIILATMLVFTPWGNLTNGHLGLIMLSLVVVAIMLGFPTAFTLMGMGMIFAWLAYRSQNPGAAMQQTLDLMVQRAYAVMANDVLISIPLFVFMGYLVERANLIEKLFKSLHLALARLPGALAVATLITCAVFATATGIVGAVVTLMGLLALPTMLRAGYSTQLSAGAITAGGCLGILIPPSVMLIVYGATAGVSVVQLYAGAFFPGIMLAGLYILYVIIVAKLRPQLAPPLPDLERAVALPAFAQSFARSGRRNALIGLLGGLFGGRPAEVDFGTVLRQLAIVLLPLAVIGGLFAYTYRSLTAAVEIASVEGLEEMGLGGGSGASDAGGGLAEPPKEEGGLAEPPKDEGGLAEPPKEGGGVAEPPHAAGEVQEPPRATAVRGAEGTRSADAGSAATTAEAAQGEPRPAPTAFWIALAVFAAILGALYFAMNWARLEIFKMLLQSFFPLALLILAVLGTIVFGLATPTEAAAVGSLGGFILAVAYRYADNLKAGAGAVAKTLGDIGSILKESTFLTAKTSAMVCWLFVGSSIFSAAFALLGGQELVENWVKSMDLSPVQFMLLSQVIIFILGWPLEWTEIIVIFMPIFIPLLDHFQIDPLFFGLLVALNLQTAFLSPPVAMAAFYLKGVSPPHVTLNQIFAGMLPFMAIQVVALALLYIFPEIGLWLPQVLYGR
jgi:TRAP-type mannitol/chloroaromatic compound transport system permease large subunit